MSSRILMWDRNAHTRDIESTLKIKLACVSQTQLEM